ncbi:MAG: hypothetical protein LV480_10010 [Methylacidiphilales bacterium]|nr:hypothetical protein [Candidatus Methylacidiphilales bacterium]
MKTLTTLLAVLALSAGLAAAQDVTGFSYKPGYNAPGTLNSKGFPNPNAPLKPQLGGVFVDLAKYGPVLISPTAPTSYGIGEKYLSAPSSREDLQHESTRAAHRDTGGIKFFSIEF